MLIFIFRLFPEVSYPVILPLFGRNCRDMLSDQVFLHEAGHYVISSKNRSDEFLTPFLLKFLLSGKQAREIAAQAATKLVSQLDGAVSDNLKAKIEEKIKGKPTFNNILWSFAKLSCMTN